jgi:hypothetical protein
VKRKRNIIDGEEEEFKIHDVYISSQENNKADQEKDQKALLSESGFTDIDESSVGLNNMSTLHNSSHLSNMKISDNFNVNESTMTENDISLSTSTVMSPSKRQKYHKSDFNYQVSSICSPDKSLTIDEQSLKSPKKDHEDTENAVGVLLSMSAQKQKLGTSIYSHLI